MQYGKVVQFFPAKGYGFIRPDAGPDIFFHITALGACQAEPKIEPGQPVKYELMPRRRKPHDDDAEGRGDTAGREPSRQRHAQLVELLDKIPGTILKETAEGSQAARHPRARRRKPTWRK